MLHIYISIYIHLFIYLFLYLFIYLFIDIDTIVAAVLLKSTMHRHNHCKRPADKSLRRKLPFHIVSIYSKGQKFDTCHHFIAPINHMPSLTEINIQLKTQSAMT